MQIIEAGENQKKLWNEFIAENGSESFLQAWEWGEFQKSTGKKVWRIALVEEEKILALVQAIRHEQKYFGNFLYCPRGPIFQKPNTRNQIPKNNEILFSKIEDMAKCEKCFFLRIDPPIEKDHASGIMGTEYLKEFKKASAEVQPKNTLMLDLSRSEEELLAGMKQKTRYNIRLAEKRGVRVRVSQDLENDFPKFWNLIEKTSTRNGIVSHPREYYLKMLEVLKENEDSGQNKLYSRLYLAEYNGKIIASNIVLLFSDLAVYLHGASSDEDKNVMAPYLLQWKQILDAKILGCKKYDFWGITVDDEKENWKGITRFKTGFGGSEKRYVGALEIVFGKTRYHAFKIAQKTRSVIFG